MVQFRGTPTFADVVIGPIHFYQMPRRAPTTGLGPEQERARLQAAYAQTDQQLDQLHQRALLRLGEEDAAIITVHRMILGDPDFRQLIDHLLSEGYSAEYAVQQAGEAIAKMFTNLEGTMQSRAADIQDVANQLFGALVGSGDLTLDEPAIVAAEELPPSAAIRLDRRKLLGFVTQGGSLNSHTAILSRTLGIPALIHVKITPEWDGAMAILDGVNGILTLDPDEAALARARESRRLLARRRAELWRQRGDRAITKDGREVLTFANVSSLYEVGLAVENDAQGVGLFRTEFLFLGQDSLPTEEEQFQFYRTAMERMGVHPVTFRTLDVGADKQLECLGLAPEENPALGCRGLRVYFQRPDIFRTQLRALLRAAAHGNLAILYPMVTTEEEVAAIQDTVHSVYRELQEEGVPCAIPRQGIMIETPSAAILADKLAHYMDFFCLGTNDLTQYTLAVDRQNPVSILGGEGHSPAVLRLVQYVVEQAHKAGISVSICGELAGDLSLTETFLSLGVDVLSVAPGRILELRARVRELDLGKKQ